MKQNNNLKVVILIGVPSSGKSYWSKKFVKDNPSYVRCNRDDFRRMLKDSQMCEPKIEDLITELQNSTINSCLNKNLNVIVDNTHLKPKYIDAVVNLVKYKADIEFRIFDISLNKAIERDKEREFSVGETVLTKMYKDYVNICDIYNFVNIKKKHKLYVEPEYNKSLKDIIIFDIDGTLAHMNGKRSPFDWDNVHKDDVDSIVAEHARDLYNNNKTLFIMTGRDESCRKLTEDWLDLYDIKYHKLLMRPEGDMRKDSIIKKELYLNNIKDKFNVKYVVDDRNVVVAMWRSLGLKCFQVNEGDF